jgi:hypothetical protein
MVKAKMDAPAVRMDDEVMSDVAEFFLSVAAVRVFVDGSPSVFAVLDSPQIPID